MQVLNTSLAEVMQIALAMVVGSGATAVVARRTMKSMTMDRVESDVADRANKQAEAFAKQAMEMTELIGEFREQVVKLNNQVVRLSQENNLLSGQVAVLTVENQRLKDEVERLGAELLSLKGSHP
jgi:predicted nuclease with TOPRIM domain